MKAKTILKTDGPQIIDQENPKTLEKFYVMYNSLVKTATSFHDNTYDKTKLPKTYRLKRSWEGNRTIDRQGKLVYQTRLVHMGGLKAKMSKPQINYKPEPVEHEVVGLPVLYNEVIAKCHVITKWLEGLKTQRPHRTESKEYLKSAESNGITRIKSDLKGVVDKAWINWSTYTNAKEQGDKFADIKNELFLDEYLTKEGIIDKEAFTIKTLLQSLVNFESYPEKQFELDGIAYTEYYSNIEEFDGFDKAKEYLQLLLIASSLLEAGKTYKDSIIRRGRSGGQGNTTNLPESSNKPLAETSSEYE